MKHSIAIVFGLYFLLAGCAQPEDSCQKINKDSDCVKYNNCNILENWKLRKIVKTYSSSQDTFVKQELYQDLLLVYNDGTMELRINNIQSSLNKWEFSACKELKLFSSISDTALSTVIDRMDVDGMIWQYTSTITDTTATWKVVNSLHFARM